MVAYEFSLLDETGEEHLIGILPERRKNPERITEGSILNWGRKVVGDNLDQGHLFFTTVEIKD